MHSYPALMLALDRGGSCHGLLYRLPPNRVRGSLTRLLEREMGWLPSPEPQCVRHALARFVESFQDKANLLAQARFGVFAVLNAADSDSNRPGIPI